jgi:hypothetical protein
LVALPVELSFFEGEKLADGSLLKWTTLSEVNNDYFEIQRSVDGINFNTIGTVNGQGNTSANTNYEFIDLEITNAIVYYRLKQIDYDGAYSYSHIISLSANLNIPKIVLIGESSKFYILTSDESKYHLKLFDSSGKLLLSEKINGIKGGRFNYSTNHKRIVLITLSYESFYISKKGLFK